MQVSAEHNSARYVKLFLTYTGIDEETLCQSTTPAFQTLSATAGSVMPYFRGASSQLKSCSLVRQTRQLRAHMPLSTLPCPEHTVTWQNPNQGIQKRGG